MEKTLLERVSRALAGAELRMMCERDGNDGARTWAIGKFGSEAAYVDHRWPDFMDSARAAIEAMRKPTNSMENAAVDAADRVGQIDNEGDTNAIYRAMIDAALQG